MFGSACPMAETTAKGTPLESRIGGDGATSFDVLTSYDAAHLYLHCEGESRGSASCETLT